MSFLPPELSHLEGLKPIIGIKLGDKPERSGVIDSAKRHHMKTRGWDDVMRDDAMIEPTLLAAGWITETPAFDRAIQDLSVFENRLLVTVHMNRFNASLHAYRAAVARLARYPLAQGRVAIYEDQPTGEFDTEDNPITESVLLSPAIEPLPATITQDVRDHETGEITGTEEVPNPAIETDEAERAAAQAVIDGTSQEVKEFDND